MKANVPEKIYLVNDDLNIKREWYKTKQVGFETTEYTRTDAFIEKACEFFAPYISDNSGGYERTAVIEAFKNYIKGG